MKKRGILLLIVVMIGSTSNVYGETFNIQSQGMDIFNTLNEDGLNKQDVEAWLGHSKGTEEMFHAVYDYSLGCVDGELKVRYDDEYLLTMSKITDDIDEYSREWNNETEQDSGFHVCYRKYYAQSPRQQRKNQNSIMEIQQYTDCDGQEWSSNREESGYGDDYSDQ